MWALKSLVGSTWGLSPKHSLHIYKTMVRPIASYGSLLWWPILQQKSSVNLCNKLQRQACLITSGCTRSCPTIPLETLLGLNPLHLHLQSEAARTAIRLQCAGNDVLNKSPLHGSIVKWVPNWELLTTQTDVITPYLSFNIRFSIIIPDRNSYKDPNFLLNDESEKWFTDGSKTDEGTGCGIYGPNAEIFIPLDENASVFQTEVLAISVCAHKIMESKPKGLAFSIYSDSQAAILAIGNVVCKSKLVKECKLNLNSLGTHNTVKLFWIPGHSGLDGNEAADSLARKGSATTPCGPGPFLSLGWSHASNAIKHRVQDLRRSYWNNQKGLNQSKKLINHNTLKPLPLHNRKNISLLVGFLTGHYPTQSFLHKIGAERSPTCRLCHESPETTEHLLLTCCRIAPTRMRLLGRPSMTPNEVPHIPIPDLTQLLRCIRDMLEP